MTLGQRFCYIWLPVVSTLCYFVAVLYLPQHLKGQLLSEAGPIELGTAACFLLAAVVLVVHLRRQAAHLLPRERVFFCLFVSVVSFVALEELSYGQHLLKYKSPSWFAAHNRQAETNLHNLLGNKPSRLIRAGANFAVPAFFIVLPWVYRRREYWRREGHWSHAVLPDPRLAVLVTVAEVVTFPRRLPSSIVPYALVDRVGEFKELYWGIAALAYAYLISQRARNTMDCAAPAVAGAIYLPAPSIDLKPAREAA